MGRRKKKEGHEDVELNVTAMLDMAFQLLTFFILTFRPAPVEGQISLRLPPPQAAITTNSKTPPGADTNNANPVQGVNTLTISIFANRVGMIESLGVGETQVSSIAALRGKLKEVFADEGNPFDQVLIQVSDGCRYDELMKIIDVCTQQEVIQDGKKQKLSKLSFVALPGG